MCGLILLNVGVEVGRNGSGHAWDVATVGAVGGTVITLAVFGLGRWVAWSVKPRRRAAGYAAGRAPDVLPSPEEVSRLTRCEREILAVIAIGLNNTGIAGKLFLGEGTVKTHVGRIFAKLGLRPRPGSGFCL